MSGQQWLAEKLEVYWSQDRLMDAFADIALKMGGSELPEDSLVLALAKAYATEHLHRPDGSPTPADVHVVINACLFEMARRYAFIVK